MNYSKAHLIPPTNSLTYPETEEWREIKLFQKSYGLILPHSHSKIAIIPTIFTENI